MYVCALSSLISWVPLGLHGNAKSCIDCNKLKLVFSIILLSFAILCLCSAPFTATIHVDIIILTLILIVLVYFKFEQVSRLYVVATTMKKKATKKINDTTEYRSLFCLWSLISSFRLLTFYLSTRFVFLVRNRTKPSQAKWNPRKSNKRINHNRFGFGCILVSVCR